MSQSGYGSPSYDPNDPYRYGAPPPPPTAGPTGPGGPAAPTGKVILRESWQMLRQDRQLILLPLLGAAAGVVGFAALFVPGFAIGLAAGADDRGAAIVGAILGGFVANVVGIFFQSALVLGASERADGRVPTLGGVLAGAATHWRTILGWAALTTTVGAVIRAVEQRLGPIGQIVGFLGGVAWAVASFFVVPVLIIEGIGPVDALRRSSATIRDTWGTSVRTTLRFGFVVFALMIVPAIVVIAGFVAIGNGGSGRGAGVALIAVGALLLVAISLVFGAISMYARTLIYRYATNRPVPGIAPELFAGAFRPRRGRRW